MTQAGEWLQGCNYRAFKTQKLQSALSLVPPPGNAGNLGIFPVVYASHSAVLLGTLKGNMPVQLVISPPSKKYLL